MGASSRVRIDGQRSGWAAGFAAQLMEQGYTKLSIGSQLGLAAHLSQWLEARGIAIDELTPEVVDHYLAWRRRNRRRFRSRRGLTALLAYLGLTDVVAPPSPKLGEWLRRYERHLVEERGLSVGVRAQYMTVAADLLAAHRPAGLTRIDVSRFVRKLLRKPNCQARLSALRSVLRFFHVAGETAIPLASVVPSMTCWRQSSLPKVLEPAQVRAVLASPDRRTSIGSRDYAVLLLMLRLGLRACEVAALTLDDLDWARGEIVVRGKGSVGRLPMPVDIGEAVVAWLRRRRRTAPTRSLFLRGRAPYRAATVSAIVALAGRALRGAGVPTGGGHRLRHTAATMMLRRGASLTEIAQVLRHRHINTTAIYAKVDRGRLRALAQPWPATDDTVGLRALAQPWPGGAP